jgi:hypothetical protein
MEQALRCRMGFHRWVRIRRTDRDLDNPAESAEWESSCRDCGRVRGSGIGFAVLVIGAAFIAAVAVWWFFSPMLGAIIMVGVVGAVGVVMVPTAISRIVQWLSMGR